MKTTLDFKQLVKILVAHGVHPMAFSYLLSEYIEKQPAKKRSKLSKLLTDHIKGQAELIRYHLNR